MIGAIPWRKREEAGGASRRREAGSDESGFSPGALLRPLAIGAAAFLAWRTIRRLSEEPLHGKVVLITGGSRGLGLALAREFAAEGCVVAICARDRKELARAAADLERRGVPGVAVPCDVADRRQVGRLIRKVSDRLGPVDILVNNAGIVQVGPMESMTREDFEEAMAVNFWGTVNTTLEALPGMRERGGGRIVNITSIGAVLAVPHLLPYHCAKFASMGFSEGLRVEARRHGIRVTTVVPGLMRTGGPANAFFKGNAPLEFSWFSLASATSASSMDAARAARRIVRATRRGEAMVTLSWQARLLRLGHGLFPGATADTLGTLGRMLPSGDGTRRQVRGMELGTRSAPSKLTWQLNRAARDLNQYGGRPRPSEDHARGAGLEGAER